MSKTGDVIGGLLAGFAVGAVVGLLFAPDKGEITRKQLCDQLDKSSDILRNSANNLLEDNGLIAELATKLRDRLERKGTIS